MVISWYLTVFHGRAVNGHCQWLSIKVRNSLSFMVRSWFGHDHQLTPNDGHFVVFHGISWSCGKWSLPIIVNHGQDFIVIHGQIMVRAWPSTDYGVKSDQLPDGQPWSNHGRPWSFDCRPWSVTTVEPCFDHGRPWFDHVILLGGVQSVGYCLSFHQVTILFIFSSRYNIVHIFL